MKCTGTARSTGQPCRRDAIAGGTVCTVHGAQFPQVKAAAAKRLAQQHLDGDIGKLLAEISDEPSPDLIDGLEHAVDRCARMVVVLGHLASGRDALGVNRFGESVADPLVGMYGEWVDRYARATKLALDAGIDERRTRVAEADARAMFDVIGEALDAAHLSPDQDTAFRAALATGLRQLEAA